MLLPFSLSRRIFNQSRFIVETLGKSSQYMDDKIIIGFYSGSCHVEVIDSNLPATLHRVYDVGEPLALTVLFSPVNCFRTGAWIKYLDALYIRAITANIDRQISLEKSKKQYFEPIDDQKFFKEI